LSFALIVALSAAGPVAAQGLVGFDAIQQPSTNPFLGGVPSGTPTAETLQLTIADAIARALEHNLGVLLAEQRVGRARGARWTALSGLLPEVTGRLAETRQKVNLDAFGFPLPAGIPSLVGPFNVFDARVYISQPIFDLHALNDARAERHNLAAAEYSYRSARDLVVLVAANAYLQALAANARAASARAQLETSEALFQQAGDLKQGGLVAGIDVLRAQVQMNADRQRGTAARNDAEKARLRLARVIGLPIGQRFALSDDIPPVPAPDLTLEAALERAYAARPDYQAALEHVRAAEAARRAIVGDALPSVRVTADYGRIGRTAGGARGTFSLAGAVDVPIFEGGRTRARLAEADADLRDRQSQAEDLRAAIYYEVQSALLDLQATRDQLDVAVSARDLAAQQLTQARDRFAAGVGTNVEVVQAQQAVALASEQYIAALYGYDVAKALLARDLGVAEDAVRQYLGGSR
jgi:outer membrane protein TolC